MSLLRIGDTFFALRFLRLLTTPWHKTSAYKAGLIDKDGNVIKNPETAEEKNVYNMFHKLVFNIKRLLNKLPFGKTTLASYATALYLVKENTQLSDEIIGEIMEEITGYNPYYDSHSALNEQLKQNEEIVGQIFGINIYKSNLE